MRFLKFFGVIVLPLFSFVGGFFLTEWVFRMKQIPYPSQLFGLAVGLGLASWTLAIVKLVQLKRSKRHCEPREGRSPPAACRLPAGKAGTGRQSYRSDCFVVVSLLLAMTSLHWYRRFLMKKWMIIASFFALLAVFGSQNLWADDAALSMKLNQVIAKQDEILKELGEIKEELRIVKVRASNQ